MPPVITVSRQLGAGAAQVMSEVAARLDYTLVDKTVLHQASGLVGVAVPPPPDEDAHGPSVLERMHLGLEFARYLQALREVLRQYAAQGRVIVIGRGSQVLLRDDATLHIRFVAPFAKRVERIQDREGLDAEAAEHRVRESDRQRGAYDRVFLKVDWADPLLYHIILNTGRIENQQAVALLVARIRAAEIAP